MAYTTTDGTASACVDSATLRRAEPSDGLRSPSPPECSAAPAPARPTGRARHARSASRPACALRTLAVFLVALAALLGSSGAASADPPPSVNPSGVGGFRSIALSWQRVGANPQIQRFQVRYSSTSIVAAGWTNIPGSNHTTTSHTVTGLADETTYVIQIRAVNANGVGPNVFFAVVTTLAQPVAPSGFTVTGGFRKLDLAWTAATVAVDRYQHRLSTDGGDTWRRDWTDITGSNATTTSHTVGSLPDATTFTVELRIRAGTARSAAARATGGIGEIPHATTCGSLCRLAR